MAGEVTLTIIGNMAGDPELRRTPGGDAVANFSIASTPRTFDRNTNEWRDGEPLFLRSTIWRESAENAVATLSKGMRVIAVGKLKPRTYEPKDGSGPRTVIEFEIDEIAPSLKYATAVVNRNVKSGGSYADRDGGGNVSQASAGGSWGGYGGGDAEPPF